MSQAVHIVSLSLSTLGVFLLGALILRTAVLRSSVSHPVFLSYLFSWMLWSAHITFSELVAIAFDLEEGTPHYIIQRTARDTLWFITQFSTLNLTFHLWRMLQGLLKGERTVAELDKKRHILPLLITPYVSGFIPLVELFYPKVIFHVPIRHVLKMCYLALTVITVIFDVASIILIWRNRTKFRQVPQSDLGRMMSITLFAKCIILCLVRVVISILCVLTISGSYGTLIGDLIQIMESSYPLLVVTMCLTRLFRRSKAEIQQQEETLARSETVGDRNIFVPRRPSNTSILYIGWQLAPPSFSRDPAMAV